jgi:hypothetical protein
MAKNRIPQQRRGVVPTQSVMVAMEDSKPALLFPPPPLSTLVHDDVDDDIILTLLTLSLVFAASSYVANVGSECEQCVCCVLSQQTKSQDDIEIDENTRLSNNIGIPVPYCNSFSHHLI